MCDTCGRKWGNAATLGRTCGKAVLGPDLLPEEGPDGRPLKCEGKVVMVTGMGSSGG